MRPEIHAVVQLETAHLEHEIGAVALRNLAGETAADIAAEAGVEAVDRLGPGRVAVDHGARPGQPLAREPFDPPTVLRKPLHQLRAISHRQLRRQLQHVLAEERHPCRAVRLLEVAAGGERRAAVEDADVIQAEEAALEDVLAEAVLAVHPPGEVEQQLVVVVELSLSFVKLQHYLMVVYYFHYCCCY